MSQLKPGFNNRPPFKSWLKASWLDIATQLLCLLIAELIYLLATPLMPRYFPLSNNIWSTSWGLQHGKPYLAEYITTLVSAIISFAVPFLVMGAIGLWWVRDFWESNAAIMGLGYALATATLFQSFIKWFIGGLRPHFLAVCVPLNPPPLPALGAKVKEAQMSFPSGHSSAAFAGFGFLALYLNSKLKVVGRKPDGGRVLEGDGGTQGFYTPRGKEGGEEGRAGAAGDGRTRHWKVVVWVLPWLLAFLISASKVRDCWHHPIDVLFGSLVGIVFAHLAYWCAFRGVYDGRVNHVPRH
ncbi:PAP2-domain-containing protein [Didymella exigua CBS 183.55]|uniref:PAP2-domain-containing protein n=1 Tax=Didymella exigua CBS 183.55 TaxID=1150837 RepID=A0A6A5RJF5_9PLEO|nr:PAP2-domain-containing protein [Didymella exigua CBS 183.55]KAF1927104.1 PAP2-domain-containing protein [Didymella exigua CBS 183.55]